MNIVRTNSADDFVGDVYVASLIDENMDDHKETAFVGSVNNGPKGLHLITYNGIMSVLNPQLFYTNGTCHIENYVDIDITINKKFNCE